MGGVCMLAGCLCRIPLVYASNANNSASATAQALICGVACLGMLWIFLWNFPVFSAAGLE
jgi:hypothetical protein